MIRLYALVSVCVLWSVAAVAQGRASSANQMAYLAAALDRWAVDVPIAVTMIEDPSPTVRARAVQVLGSTADASSIPLLRRYAADSDSAVRAEVMLAAGRLGPEGLDLAIGGLGDASPTVRQAASWAACHAGDAAWEAISRILTTEKNRGVLETALANLWRFENSRWQPAASGFANHASPYLRRAAAYSLSRTGDPAARGAQRKLAKDAEPVIRATILRGFARGDLAAGDLAALLSALDDPDWRVQAAVCGVLAARGPMKLSEAARSKVASFFSSSHPQLAGAALDAAVAHSTIGSAAELGAAIDDSDPWLASRALAALAARDAKAAAGIAARWSTPSSEMWQRRAAAGVAVELGPESETRAQTDSDAGVRLAWLSSLDSDRAAARSERLLALLAKDPDPAVRAQTLSLLREAGAAPPVEDLIALHTAWRRDTMPDARTEALVAAMEATEAGSKRRAILEYRSRGPGSRRGGDGGQRCEGPWRERGFSTSRSPPRQPMVSGSRLMEGPTTVARGRDGSRHLQNQARPRRCPSDLSGDLGPRGGRFLRRSRLPPRGAQLRCSRGRPPRRRLGWPGFCDS